MRVFQGCCVIKSLLLHVTHRSYSSRSYAKTPLIVFFLFTLYYCLTLSLCSGGWWLGWGGVCKVIFMSDPTSVVLTISKRRASRTSLFL